MKKNKQGQLGNLSNSVLTIVVAIIILVMGLVIIQDIRDLPSLTASESGAQANETVTAVAETGKNLGAFSYPASVCSITAITNATNGVTIPSSNYTVTNCNVAFTTGTSGGFNNSNWNVTYTYTYGGSSFTAANTSLVGLGTLSDFIPLIVLAVAASIIIGLILAGFAFGGRNR